MNYKECAKQILASVGGKANVGHLVHCATRLRFQLNDEAKVDAKKLEEIEIVKGVVKRSGQLQLIVGEGSVDKVYDELIPMIGVTKKEINKAKEQTKQKNAGVNTVLEAISAIFAPVIPAIVGAGLIWGISYCLTVYNLVDPSNSSYIILNSMGNAAFYFLPITMGFSAGKYFGCNPYVSAVIGGAMIHPSIAAFAGQTVSFFGIPMMIQGYTSSIIPIILTIWLVSYVEKFLKKHVPDMFALVVTPTVVLIVGTVLALSVSGPLGYWIGSFIAEGVVWLYDTLGPLGGALQGFLHSIEVITGMQVAMSPITAQNLATYGYDLIYPLAAAANTAQCAACLYIFLKTKNKKMKSVSGSSAVSAFIGVTEPAIFGVTLKYKKIFIASCLGAACGGAIMSTFRVVYYGFGLVPFGTIVLAFGDTFTYYMIGVVVSFVMTLVFCFTYGKNEIARVENITAEPQNEIAFDAYERLSLKAPVKGNVVALEAVKDETFAKGLVGKGIAIYPEDHILVSPVNGVIKMVFKTGHAIAIKAENGAEILLHIGIDTVKDDGKHFEPLVKCEETVKVGQPIIKFDLETLSKQYDMVIPVLITNKDIFSDIQMTDAHHVTSEDTILEVIG